MKGFASFWVGVIGGYFGYTYSNTFLCGLLTTIGVLVLSALIYAAPSFKLVRS